MNNEKFLILLMFVMTIFFSLLLSFQNPTKAETIYLLDEGKKIVNISSTEVFLISNIECTSQSMGLLFSCRDTIYSKLLNENSTLTEGKIYKYMNEKGYLIVHRLVKCLDETCQKLIFKGDNNYVADKIIDRNSVVEEVIQVRFG